jgi:peptide/nickel transport system substrate-binding protein
VAKIGAVLAAMLLVVVGCTSGSEGTGSAASTPDASAPRGGTLRVAEPDDLVAFQWYTIDPQRGYTFPAIGLGRCCLFRTLYSYNGRPAEQGGTELQPDLAEGPPEVSTDGLTWTFRLRGGLRYAPPFADTTITSLDLVRALERMARVGLNPDSYGFYYQVIRGFDDYASGEAASIVGLETPDDRTLVVRLDQVAGDLAYRFSLAATSPIPDGAADGHDKDYTGFFAASGPYMIEGSEALDPSAPPREQEPAAGWIPAELGEDGAVVKPGSLVLVRNPSWDPRTDRLRPAYADRIEITLGGSDDEIAEQVDAGSTDLVYLAGSPFEQVARYEEDPELAHRVYRNVDNVVFALTMNLAMPPFDDVHVRRAVSRAIDEAALVSLLAEPPHGPFGSNSAVVTTHLVSDGLVGGLLRDFDPYPFDPEAAREEMAASTYDRDHDGRCDVAACRGVTALVNDEGVIPDQARAIRRALGDLGIELTLKIASLAKFFDTLLNPRSQIPIGVASSWIEDYPDGAGSFPALFGAPGLETGTNTPLLGATPAQLRAWGYATTSVPSVDDRIQVCSQRRGVTRTACWTELDQYLVTEVVPWVPYMISESSVVVSDRVVVYSFDQFAALPALDRIALAPGSD